MATGRVLQFDHARGYGFVAADDSGEDVFLHASVFNGDLDELAPGTQLEFNVMAGDRGRKAFAAHLGADDRLTPQSRSVAEPVAAQPVPSQSPVRAYRISTNDDEHDEELRDALSQAEFGQELTELLLSDVPTLTGQQIIDIRYSILQRVKKHGWVNI